MATYNSFKRIDGDAIVDGQVRNAEIAVATVNTADFANNAVGTDQIADGAVTVGKLTNDVDISGKTVTYRTLVNGDFSGSAAIAGNKFASGAMATNLGGTPLNRAGGTMSGQLRLPNGTSAAPALRGPDSNTGISFSGNQTTISAGGQNALILDSSDRVTYPNNVNFTASGTSGWRYANSYGGLRWRSLNGTFGWTTRQSGGSNFDNGNGAFTAPIAGFYQFHFETYARNDANNNNGYYHMSFGINGGNAMVGGRTPHGIFAHSTVSRYYPNGTHMDLGTYLNAGQYVQVRVYWHNNQTRFHGAHSCFNGYLVA